MLAKFINENKIEKYKGYVVKGSTLYANDEDKARQLGYKDLVVEDMPEIEEGEYLTYYYVDGEVITKKWKIEHEIEESE